MSCLKCTHTVKAEPFPYNHMENAILYTPSHGIVEITLKREGKNVLFQVADSGPGISPDERENAFIADKAVKTLLEPDLACP